MCMCVCDAESDLIVMSKVGGVIIVSSKEWLADHLGCSRRMYKKPMFPFRMILFTPRSINTMATVVPVSICVMCVCI